MDAVPVFLVRRGLPRRAAASSCSPLTSPLAGAQTAHTHAQPAGAGHQRALSDSAAPAAPAELAGPGTPSDSLSVHSLSFSVTAPELLRAAVPAGGGNVRRERT